MSEDFRTKLRAFEDRLEREHNDPEPREIRFCRHCDEDTEMVSVREALTKIHGEAVTTRLIDEYLIEKYRPQGSPRYPSQACGDCGRPYEMEDHALLDFQQARISLLAGLVSPLRDAKIRIHHLDRVLRDVYEIAAKSNGGARVDAIKEIAKKGVPSVDQERIEGEVKIRELKNLVQIFDDSDARDEARGYGKLEEGTIGAISRRMLKEELAEAEREDA